MNGPAETVNRPPRWRCAAGWLRAAVRAMACAAVFLSSLPAFNAAGASERIFQKAEDIPSECVVRLDVEIKNTNDESRMWENIFFSFFRFSTETDPAIADYKVTGGTGNIWYLLFLDGCNRRFEWAGNMVRAYMAQYPGEASITLHEEAVQPGGILTKSIFIPGKPKFTRSQCIVRVKLIYREKGESYGEEETFSHFFLKYAIEKYPRISLFSSSAGHSNLYIQYWKSCDRKNEMTREMITAYKRKYPGGSDFVVTDDIIKPGDLSSEAFGLHWIDGHSDNSRLRRRR